MSELTTASVGTDAFSVQSTIDGDNKTKFSAQRSADEQAEQQEANEKNGEADGMVKAYISGLSSQIMAQNFNENLARLQGVHRETGVLLESQNNEAGKVLEAVDRDAAGSLKDNSTVAVARRTELAQFAKSFDDLVEKRLKPVVNANAAVNENQNWREVLASSKSIAQPDAQQVPNKIRDALHASAFATPHAARSTPAASANTKNNRAGRGKD